MSSIKLFAPWIIDFTETRTSGDTIVVFWFRGGQDGFFETLRIERSSEVGIGISDFDAGCLLLSEVLSVLLGPCLEKSRYIDVFIPFFFVLLSLEAFDFNEVCHQLCQYKII